MDERITSREHIEDVAIALFIEQGVKATSINQLVKACGIAKGTFYIYFKDKDDLIDAVFSKYVDAFILEVISKNKDIHKVALFSKSLLAYFRKQPFLLKELRSNLGEQGRFSYIDRMIAAFKMVIKDYLKFYDGTSIQNLDLYMNAIIVMILEICYTAIISQEATFEDSEVMLSDVFKRFFGCAT